MKILYSVGCLKILCDFTGFIMLDILSDVVKSKT